MNDELLTKQAERRYLTDPTFHALVYQIFFRIEIGSGVGQFTPEDASLVRLSVACALVFAETR